MRLTGLSMGLLITGLFLTEIGYSQTVGISGNGAYVPNANSILDLDDDSGTKGALLPRMSAAQRGIKGTPHPGSSTGFTASLVVGTADEGLTIFNTSTNQYNYWDGTDWQIIPNSTSGNTLDDAYDEGGAGVGRTITADNGAVHVSGTDGLHVDGDVGIGTTTPSVALEVRDDDNTNGQLLVAPTAVNAQDAMIVIRGARDNTAPSATAKIRFQNYDNNALPTPTIHTFGSLEGQMTNGTTNVGDIVFRNSSDGLVASLTETMRLTKDGKVDINDLASGLNGAVVTSNSTGVLNEVNFSGLVTDVLRGDGTFGPAGVGLGDNLGNHTATTDLDMDDNAIVDIDWATSDDGAGSELDADLLDGQQGTYYLDNTDNQDLSLSSNTLSLTNDGTPVDLSGYLDNTDNQDLSLSGNTLSLTNDGTPVDLSAYLDADDLGNHTATTDLNMANNAITNIDWATSDDGAGSGLDADLLDGQEGTYYLDADNHVYDGGSTLPASSTEAAIDALDAAVNAITDDWTQSGSDLYPNSTAWNVGVGTTTPGSKLDVYSASDAGIRYSGVRAHRPASFGQYAFMDYAVSSADAYFGSVYTGSAGVYGSIHFRQYTQSNVFRDAMNIDSDGEVGIGTTTPVSKLEIEGPSANWNETSPGLGVGSIHLDPGATTNHYGSAITWGASDAGAGDNAQAGIYTRSDGAYGTKMYFGTTDSYAAGSKTRMMIDNTGEVGIGTSSPAQALDVLGDINSSSGYRIGNTAASGQFLRGNGTRFVSSAIQPSDIPTGSGNYIQNQFTGAQTADYWISGNARIQGNTYIGSDAVKYFYPNGGRINVTAESAVGVAEFASYGMYLPKTGQTYNLYTGGSIKIGHGESAHLDINDTSTRIEEGSGNSIRHRTNSGYIDIGPQNATWAHIQTDMSRYYLNKGITVDQGLIGSYDEDLSLQTSGTTRITALNSNGNVGIGTTSPGHKLDVAGNANAEHLLQGPLVARPKATWSQTGTSTGAVIIKLPGTTANYGMLHMQIDVYEYNSNSVTSYIIGGHNWSGQWYNYACRTIGTSTKKIRLAVKDGQYAVVLGEQGSSWSYGHVVLSKITNGGYYSGIIDLGGAYSITQDNAPETYTWITSDLNDNQTVPSTGVTNYLARWTSPNTLGIGVSYDNGTNVGIGTTTPGHKLHVNSSVAEDGIRVNAATYPEIMFQTSGTTRGYLGIAGSAGGYGTGTLANSLILRSESAYAHLLTGGTNIVLTANGTNVGIGTTTPGSYKLNVQGGSAQSVVASSSDAPLVVQGTNTWSGIRFQDSGSNDHIYYNGGNSTFAIGGGGSNVSGKKLHIDGGATVGVNYDAVSVPSNGLAVEGSAGIGTNTPSAQLEVVGGSQIATSVLTDGYMEDVSGIVQGNYIPSHSWDIGSGSVGIFGENGGGDNSRVWGDGPYGGRAILWRGTGTGNDADGGWNTSNFEIDNAKTYRVSVWIKKVGGTGGTTYFGVNDNGLTRLDGTAQGNPYFWCGDLPVLDRWYLLVGYIQGNGDPNTDNHGGIYDGTTGQKVVSYTGTGNCNSDFEFTGSSTVQRQRAYLYYNTSGGHEQYFWGPRFEEVNGKEPSIQSMLGITPGSVLDDDWTISGNNMYAAVSGNVGIGTTPSGTWKLEVNGKLGTTGINESSDARLKKGILPIQNALERVLKMNGVTYSWKTDEFPERNFEKGLQYGLIAQELEKIIPELVETEDNEEGWKSIEYTHLVPVLIEAIKELNATVESQQATISSQNEENDALKASIGNILDRLTELENVNPKESVVND